MLTIFHGDNVIASRKVLGSLIAQAQKKQQKLIRISPSNFQIETLTTSLNPDLFNQEKLIILDDFQKFSPKQQKTIAEQIQNNPSPYQIIIWAGKKLTAKTLKLFPQKREQLFKPDNTVFLFLDSLSPDNKQKALLLLNQALDKENPGLIFYLLAGRIEDLIIVATGHQDKLSRAPWQKNRLINQAKKFSLPQLKTFLEKLILLDYRQKTGKISYSFEFGLELLIANL